MSATDSVEKISPQELDALISRIEHAIEHELALSVEDMKLLLLAITTLSTLQQKIEDKDSTLYKLRKLLGMIKQSEKRSNSNRPRGKKKKKNRGSSSRSRNKNKPKPKIAKHKLDETLRGSTCSACERGKLYKFEPATLLRITGHAPYEATQHVSERLRCNACQQVVTAKLSDAVLADGDPNQKYGYSARALMAIHKFYSGLPYNHQENLSDMLGVMISSSTIFDQCEHLANSIMPIFYYLQRYAANADRFLLDDTRNQILEQEPEVRPNRNGKGERLRTGVYSSGVIALRESYEIVLFETSLGHAGEFIDSILKKRDLSLPAPVLMSDALSSNKPTVTAVIQSYCNVHCRREFFDMFEKQPEMIEWVLDIYGKIWVNEDIVTERSLDKHQRLAYHKEHSLPVMKELKDWAEKKLQSDDFEEHSDLGKAIKYLLRHYEKLIQFCKVPGALIDNNRMEETLKIVIRNRKTSHFFKTVNGASVANVITSIIATAMRAEVNLFDYLVALQQNQNKVKANPEAWLPWNYHESLKETEKIADAA